MPSGRPGAIKVHPLITGTRCTNARDPAASFAHFFGGRQLGCISRLAPAFGKKGHSGLMLENGPRALEALENTIFDLVFIDGCRCR